MSPDSSSLDKLMLQTHSLNSTVDTVMLTT